MFGFLDSIRKPNYRGGDASSMKVNFSTYDFQQPCYS